jgi:uncharacterized protein with HEPN domain
VSFSDQQILQHILEAVEVANLLVQEGHDQFFAQSISQFAADTVVNRIGRGAKDLSEDTLALMPEIPWKYVKGMRDRIAHASINNDYQIIWSSLVNDIPTIGTAVRRIMES